MSGLVSLIVGLVCIFVAYVLEGGVPAKLIQPTAAMIVFGGTLGATGLSFPISYIKRAAAAVKIVFSERKDRTGEIIEYLKNISVNARKNGLLSMDNEVSSNEDMDPMIRKGLRMAIDGTQADDIRSAMETEAASISARHKEAIDVFDSAGGFAPTMGVVGTVMGLVSVLNNLSNPSVLGEKIAVAFIATFYGIATANILFLPMANKLKAVDKQEEIENGLIIEGVLSIQAGNNPNVVADKLISYLDRKTQQQFNKESEKK